jgi:hypothetical protein
MLSGLKNMAEQLWLIQLGDTLRPDHLDVTVAKSVRQHFSATELESLNSSRQMKDTLAADAVWFSRVSTGVFYCAVLFGLYVLFVAWRKRSATRHCTQTKLIVSFILILWLGVVANAFATGALSKPHHRYQARIAWLLVLPALLLWRDPVRSLSTKPI